MLSLENNLNYYSTELQFTNKISSINVLNNLISKTKIQIKNLFFKTQNLIMVKCFKNEFNISNGVAAKFFDDSTVV